MKWAAKGVEDWSAKYSCVMQIVCFRRTLSSIDANFVASRTISVFIWRLGVAVQVQTLYVPFYEREQGHEEANEEKYVCRSLILFSFAHMARVV